MQAEKRCVERRIYEKLIPIFSGLSSVARALRTTRDIIANRSSASTMTSFVDDHHDTSLSLFIHNLVIETYQYGTQSTLAAYWNSKKLTIFTDAIS